MSSTPTIPRVRRQDGPDAVIGAARKSGAVIVEDFLDDDALAAVNAELAPHVADADPNMVHVNDVLQTFYRGVRNVTGLPAKSRAFVDHVLLDPVLLAAADAIIGPNCAGFQLNVAQLIAREPGAERQWLHRDQNVWKFLPSPHPEIELASIVALRDFTPENGATVLVPGSHRWDAERRPQENEIAYAEMPAGAAVIYLGSTIHAGGHNRSDQLRKAIHLSYVVGWLRQEENTVLATPPDVARRLPRRAQELVGYAMHDGTAFGAGYLGCVDLRDPVEMLAAGDLSARFADAVAASCT
jgi:ectoine hydroxylase-related dioxygenase (phytanoyl-CoA dioxygenase family)